MSEQRNNSGNSRPNKDKKSPSHKDYQGKCVVDGKEYWIAAWRKEKDSDFWLSVEFTPIVAVPEL